ncbi:prephenate dehydratase domain-containing protein [Ekhidna sp.]|jgi:prephenate dehydratase|uniref:prephenate dehydratase n=1 Tax=Ekhidna sp. TaxID=2608089 RepID=UPI0032EAFC0D
MTEKIAIQGLRGSFHHEAATHFFGEELELIECESFQSVVQSVTEGTADKGIMAIENSLAGCILPNYQLLRKNEVEVIGEVGLRVHLNLMTLAGTKMEELEEVRSHQMALRQCGDFFSQYPNIRLVEHFDTAGSAQEIEKKNLKRIAAVAGRLAAKEYGLEILKEGIEDHDLNYTSFKILQRKGGRQEVDPDKVSIYFQTSNDPGSLAKALTVISGLGINLGKLQSHPVPSKNTLYGFYATLELTDADQLKDLKTMMKRMMLEFEILGVYKKGETYG